MKLVRVIYIHPVSLLTPTEGYDIREFQETENAGGGRVFHTLQPTQDGNFRVGELFKVEQLQLVLLHLMLQVL